MIRVCSRDLCYGTPWHAGLSVRIQADGAVKMSLSISSESPAANCRMNRFLVKFKLLPKIETTSLVAAMLACSIVLSPALPVCAQGSDDNTSATPSHFTVGGASSSNSSQASSSSLASDIVVDDVKIEGNRLVSTEEINSVVKTRKGDKYDRDVVMQDLKAIHGMGYFDEQSLQVNPEMTSSGVLLKIRVTENAPITQFSIRGNDAISTEEITKLFSDQLGKPQNLNALSSAIDKVEQGYHERGFVLARVTDVKDDPDGSVELVINEGTIDNIEIVGNKKTKDFIIRNGIKTKAGAVYNEKQLTNDLKKMYANGYFQDIRRSLVPSATNPDKYTLKVEVDEKRTGSVGLGGGVDSVAGPFGSLNFSDGNFRGRGQVLSFSSQVGSGTFNSVTNSINNAGNTFLPTGRTYNIEANWVEPSLRGSNVSMAVSGFGRNMGSMFIDQAMQRTVGVSTTFSKPLARGWNANLGLTGENTFLKNVAGVAANQDILTSMASRALVTGMASTDAQAAAMAGQSREQQLRGGTFFTVNPSLTRDTRDSAMDATTGSFLKASISPSAGIGGGFMKAGLSASKFKSFGKNKNFTLALNAQAGTAVGGLPQFAQYRLGGWNGVRGYRSFSDLGTGAGMLMGTAELRAKLAFLPDDNKITSAIKKNVKIAGFFDYGQVVGNSTTNSLLSRSNFGASVGLGLRINMPMVGLVRIDYGLPIVSSILGNRTPRMTVGFGEKF